MQAYWVCFRDTWSCRASCDAETAYRIYLNPTVTQIWSTGSVRGGTSSWKGSGILSALLRRLASAFCHVAVRWSSPRGPSFCNSWLLPTLFPLFFSKPLLLLWYFQFKFRIEGLLLLLVLKTTFYTLTLLDSSISILTSCCLWLPHFCTHPCSWDSLLLPWGFVPLGESIQNHSVLNHEVLVRINWLNSCCSLCSRTCMWSSIFLLVDGNGKYVTECLRSFQEYRVCISLIKLLLQNKRKNN